MSMQDNITTIETDISAFFDGLKTHAIAPVSAAVKSGGKDVAADANAVIGVAQAAATAASLVPGTVGVLAKDVTLFIPFAQQLLAFFTGGASAAVAAMTQTPATPPAGALS